MDARAGIRLVKPGPTIDLLGTPEGVEMVENYLEQIEYGVYI